MHVIRGTRIRRSMSRTYLIFADIEGKLDVLRVQCTRCSRKGRYTVRNKACNLVRSTSSPMQGQP
jgi:hypothetical protein